MLNNPHWVEEGNRDLARLEALLALYYETLNECLEVPEGLAKCERYLCAAVAKVHERQERELERMTNNLVL